MTLLDQTKIDCLALVDAKKKEKLKVLLARLVEEAQQEVYQDVEFILHHAGVTCLTTWTTQEPGVLLEFYDAKEDPTIEGETLRETCEKAMTYFKNIGTVDKDG